MAEEKDLESKLILQKKIDALSDKLADQQKEMSKKDISSLEKQMDYLLDQEELLDDIEENQIDLSDKANQQLKERIDTLHAEIGLQDKIDNLYEKYQETAEDLSDDELKHLETQILQNEKHHEILKKRGTELEKRINNPLQGLTNIFANIGQGLTGGLKGLSTTASESFKESGFGKTIDLGAKLFGKSETLGDDKMFGGIREMFTHPDVLKQKKKESLQWKIFKI